MFDRLKAAARQKLQRAVAEVVETELARSHQRLLDMHAETMAVHDRLSERLSALSDGVNHRLDALEQRERRDIEYSLDVAAAEASAAFVLDHLPKAPAYRHPHDHVVAQAVQGVLGPSGRDGRNRQVRPQWQLLLEQAMHQVDVSGDLIVVHPR